MAEPVPPVIRELFALLPCPGKEFPLVDRLRWLRACDAVLCLLYKHDDAGAVIETAELSRADQ